MARRERVAQAIKEEVSTIIHDKLNDPRLGFVTITRVELSPDLRFARIFYSVLGKDEDYQKTQEALASSTGFIRKLVAERVKLRFAVDIAFKEDRSTEHSIRIEEILRDIKESDENQKRARPDKETP